MKKIINLIKYLFVITVVVISILPFFISESLGSLDIDQILFLLVSDQQGANLQIVVDFILFAIPYVIATIGLILVFIVLKINPMVIEINTFTKKIKKQFPGKPKFYKTIILFMVSLMTISFLFDSKFKIFKYVKDLSDVGVIYENHYINPEDVKLKFPDEKKNLIILVLESMMTNFSDVTIGKEEVDLIPNLYDVASENLSFSNTEAIGGAKQLAGLSWTIAALVGLTAGINLKIPIDGNSYGKNGVFLPGITTMGEVLKSEGYSNHFLIGSDGEFAGRDTYFETHGDYNVIDLKKLREEAFIPKDYHVFWGMEDLKLFEYAKDLLLELNESDDPFNLTMLTVDSHFMDGYTDEECELDYSIAYANAIACSDKNVSDFLEWLVEQDFYEDTTIILIGDHLTMNADFLSLSNNDNYTIFNAILNPSIGVVDERVLYNRDFSIMDFFPTTLAAIGVEIEGDRLGLGVNLFSGEETLLEMLGLEKINEELTKRSRLYSSFY